MQWTEGEEGYPLNAARGGCFITGASQRGVFEDTKRPERVLITHSWLDGNVEGQVCLSESWFLEAAEQYGMLRPDVAEKLRHELSDQKHAYDLAMHELEQHRHAMASLRTAMKAAGLE